MGHFFSVDKIAFEVRFISFYKLIYNRCRCKAFEILYDDNFHTNLDDNNQIYLSCNFFSYSKSKNMNAPLINIPIAYNIQNLKPPIRMDIKNYKNFRIKLDELLKAIVE